MKLREAMVTNTKELEIEYSRFKEKYRKLKIEWDICKKSGNFE